MLAVRAKTGVFVAWLEKFVGDFDGEGVSRGSGEDGFVAGHAIELG